MPKEPEKIEHKQPRWLIPIITTVIGIVFSGLVAWYQINLNEEQTLEAEKERSKSVKNELVQIVEEHIINQKALDVSRLARLSEFRARQENLLVIPTVSDVIENAEFNIIKSQYLEFEKKQQFKKIFDGIYSEITIPSNIKYSGLFENTVNDIYASIHNGKTKEAAPKINKLVSDFNIKISELEARLSARESRSFIEIIRAVISEPKIIVLTISSYIILLYLFMVYKRKLRRRRELEEEFKHRAYFEYMNERNEAMDDVLRNKFEEDSAENPNK